MIMRPTIVKLVLNESIAGLLKHKLEAVHGAPNFQKKWMPVMNHLILLFNLLAAGNSHSGPGQWMIPQYPHNYPLCKQQVIIKVGISHC
jgi:hypothetical protein